MNGVISMGQKLEERISYYESPTYAIAETLREKGYQIADTEGVRVLELDELSHYYLGILEPQEPIELRLLGLNFPKKQKALYLGTLWVDNQSRGAIPDKNWVLDVYGRDNVPKLMELVKELSEPNNVCVQVGLVSEQPREENNSWIYRGG